MPECQHCTLLLRPLLGRASAHCIKAGLHHCTCAYAGCSQVWGFASRPFFVWSFLFSSFFHCTCQVRALTAGLIAAYCRSVHAYCQCDVHDMMLPEPPIPLKTCLACADTCAECTDVQGLRVSVLGTTANGPVASASAPGSANSAPDTTANVRGAAANEPDPSRRSCSSCLHLYPASDWMRRAATNDVWYCLAAASCNATTQQLLMPCTTASKTCSTHAGQQCICYYSWLRQQLIPNGARQASTMLLLTWSRQGLNVHHW